MNKLQEWLGETSFKNYTIESALADASFRKYYRLRNGDKTAILMDSSSEKNSLKSFIHVTTKLINADVCAPKIFEQNQEDGFLILEDFGTTHYLDILNNQNYKAFYTKAINTILKMQKADTSSLPLYDKDFLHFEMDLMQEWYLEKLLKLKIGESQIKLLKKTLDSISSVVLEQPQGVFVHRDFHSRNIMLKSDKKIGIIDYQDAMSGAVTYDLASLLKDCYVAYDRKEIKKLALEFRDKKGIKVDDETFIKWFDFMGMQRHIKVLGVFSRLSIRDKKNGYLKNIPLTLKYLIDTAQRYEQTKEFASFLNSLK
ncbi:Aminoglycoside phosphotransferase [Sulfurimonas denitrificans DSM 1251]|jgi:aminoglycoside/choline kinase family phosphotransferase|uniref:Aminoglycoside phosphotransferase n=1 Tax=Sulfurimonas denitrificans (strain ATCC 33889 / DSM 1251) TaxID=326298 RepID=Q30NT5_SULDN|nr:phosphotransferase [Sulfurimonas denitrificans]ABB45346.1 Aminoglycoside phosphotransferase [Sulfurimonas denitrificans DSM 1251]MDD3442605.1 phosphotransferase [Sulfurimonas denitrificans]